MATDWRKLLPSCAPSECYDAKDFCEAVHLCLIELDLIEEDQEAADNYTSRQVSALKKFVAKHSQGITHA